MTVDENKKQMTLKDMNLKAASLYKEIHPLNRTYYIETYGCQMNVRDSESIEGILQSCGFTRAISKETADMILFNTCCIRDHAEKRVFGNIGALKQMKDERQDLIIGVCGCMMQQKNVAEKLMKRFPFVNMTFGTNVLHRLPDLLTEVLDGNRMSIYSDDDIAVIEGIPSYRVPSSSAFVNITYGCNNFCSYCIVPYVRSRERSRTVDSIKKEVLDLVDKGYSEITLLGQNVNSYGKDIKNASFAELLTELNEVPNLKRIRFMSSHPKDLTDDVINAIAENEKVCPHVHLPVQSGSDRILKLMNRRYTREQYLDIVNRLRSRVLNIEITTDIIVGFPEETEADFLDTLNLVREVGFSAAFTFKYSRRQGTRAASMENQIDEAVKRERLSRLNALQEAMTVQNNSKYIGYTDEVLIEGADGKQANTFFGKYPNFKMVYFRCENAEIGSYVKVRVVGHKKNSLIGEIVHD